MVTGMNTGTEDGKCYTKTPQMQPPIKPAKVITVYKNVKSKNCVK